MVGRILIGNRNGQNGIWVSKPGFDVATASDDQMLLSPNIFMYQPVQSGHVDLPYVGSTTRSVSIPLGSLAAGVSRVFVLVSAWAQEALNYPFSPGGILFLQEQFNSNIIYSVGGGILNIVGTSLPTYITAGSSPDTQVAYIRLVHASWVVFRARY